MAYSKQRVKSSSVTTTALRVVVYDSVTGQIVKEGGNFSVNSSSQVMIGTTSATGKLTVRSDGIGTGKAFVVENSSGSTTAYIQDNGKVQLAQGTNVLPSLISVGGYFGLNFPSTTEITMGRIDGNTLYRFGENGLGLKGYIGWSTDPSATSSDVYLIRGSAGLLKLTDATLVDGGTLQMKLLILEKTITAAATTGAQTINKSAGSVNFAAAATSLVVTNSLVTTSSVIICTVGTNDTTLKSVSAVAGSGSFTMYANDSVAGATAETRVNFVVFN